ncbi:MAG: tetratricopeptide repeat protein [Moorea sp. SIO4A3]|nr:tetratricopeptide repeat protein [Moorena sp. SIO4A3]
MSYSTQFNQASDHREVIFRWLHLTDLHLGMDGLENLWPNVEETFFKDLKYLYQKVGLWDLVMFTGDITQRGSKSEFDQVDTLLTDFWDKFELMGFQPKFLAVPGNHDLVRPKNQKDPILKCLKDLWNDPDIQKPFWNDIESAQRQLVIKAFQNYVQWWDNTKVPKPDISKGILPGDFSTTIEKDGFKLGILGLNSAFLQLMGGDRKGKLALDMRQFNGACHKNGPSWAKDHHACLLLTHHPQDWLTDEAQAQLIGEIHSPPERFALHLFGHMHEAKLRSLAEGGANARRRLQGCSLFGMEGWGDQNQERFHGYSLCELKIEGNTASLRIYPRKAEKRQDGGWEIDRDVSFRLPKGEDGTEPVAVKLLREGVKNSIGSEKKKLNPLKELITSRENPEPSIKHIDLDVLSPEVALELLRKLVGKERIDNELNEAEALCEWLGYLPLGLQLVGGYLDLYPRLTIAKVQERLENEKLAVQALLDQKQGQIKPLLGVAAAFELSWNDLPPQAQQLGCRLSLFAPAPFEWSLVESCVIETEDEEEWDKEQEALEELRDRVAWPTANRFLVNRNLLQLSEQQTYRLHQLIREFFQTKLAQLPEGDGYKQRFCQAMVAVAKEIPERPTRDDITAVTPAIPHLKEAATVLTDWLRDEDLILPFVGLGRFYEGQGTYYQAEPWYQQCLEITRNRLGQNHPDVAESLNKLAVIYWYLGRYDEAEPLYKQALEMRTQLLGDDHTDVATSLNNLGLLYWYLGRYDQAEALYQQALEIYQHLLGHYHPSVATSLNNLGLLYKSMRRYDQAEALYQQALEIYQEKLGHHHTDVATSLHNLGLLYKSMRRYDQAEPLYQQALEIYQEKLGDDHPNVATSLNNLGTLYESMGRYDEAEPHYQQALEMRKQLLGHYHPWVASSLNNLGTLYESMGRYDEAEPLYQQALEIAEQRLGSNHPNTVTYHYNLERLRDDL